MLRFINLQLAAYWQAVVGSVGFIIYNTLTEVTNVGQMSCVQEKFLN